MTADPFLLWTVTQNPSDYPGLFVARQWRNLVPTEVVLIAPTLKALRAQLPPGLLRFPSHELDDPVIVEIWL